MMNRWAAARRNDPQGKAFHGSVVGARDIVMDVSELWIMTKPLEVCLADMW